MDLKEIMEAKKVLEQNIFRAVMSFELESGCMVETIGMKHKRVEAGIKSRDTLEKITIRAILPEV